MTDKMIGHGWVHPLPNGLRARCGGPGLCLECCHEEALVERARRELHILPAPGGCIRRGGWKAFEAPTGERVP